MFFLFFVKINLIKKFLDALHRGIKNRHLAKPVLEVLGQGAEIKKKENWIHEEYIIAQAKHEKLIEKKVLYDMNYSNT